MNVPTAAVAVCFGGGVSASVHAEIQPQVWAWRHPGCGPGVPWVWAWSPLGVVLETHWTDPQLAHPPHPRCGPGDPLPDPPTSPLSVGLETRQQPPPGVGLETPHQTPPPTSPGVGLETPWPDPPALPLSVGLETPPRPDCPTPPWVWAWRPPPNPDPPTCPPPPGVGLETHPLPREQNSWHTLLKRLPCPNFVAGGKNRLCRMYTWKYG